MKRDRPPGLSIRYAEAETGQEACRTGHATGTSGAGCMASCANHPPAAIN